jgi:hypothetical protein
MHMKRSTSALFVCTLLASSAAFAQRADRGGESSDRDTDEGPGGTRLAFDLDYANTFDAGIDSGMGGAVRFGREYDIVILSLTPEFMGSFHQFSGSGSPRQFAGMAGGKAAIGKIVEPGVFAHVGVGHADLPGDDLTGLALDLGVALDLTLVPIVDVGVHAAYDALTWRDERNFDWYRLGAHLAIAP